MMEFIYKWLFFKILPRIEGETLASTSGNKSCRIFTNGPFTIEVWIRDRRKPDAPIQESKDDN